MDTVNIILIGIAFNILITVISLISFGVILYRIKAKRISEFNYIIGLLEIKKELNLKRLHSKRFFVRNEGMIMYLIPFSMALYLFIFWKNLVFKGVIWTVNNIIKNEKLRQGIK